MREIKFRAWNEAENRWCNCDEASRIMFNSRLDKYGGGQEIELSYDEDEEKSGCWVNVPFILMQFTGLHDKNGKEIYEGDILPGQWIVMWWPEQAQFVLGNGSLNVNEAAKEEFVIGLLNNDEIIGNIYDNPELLESK